ncbi:MAG: hypothetical protein WC473_01565 [Patescibacteria group bacterium]
MGIAIEFNPDLALRSHDKFITGKRRREECLPEKLEVGKAYDFLKVGQRNYWLNGELPLLVTEGDENLSLPVASIVILEATHLKDGDRVFTKGKYLIKEVFNNDSSVHFNGYSKIQSV